MPGWTSRSTNGVSHSEADRVSRPKLPAGVVVILLALATTACVGRYSPQDLANGVPINVKDPEGLVESAILISFDALPDSNALSQRIGRMGPIAIDGSNAGFDTIIGYRSGPYCAIAPDVAAAGQDGSLTITVSPISRGNCDDMQYDEAIGFIFTRQPSDVNVMVERP